MESRPAPGDGYGGRPVTKQRGLLGLSLQLEALIIRIVFWGILYYDFNKDPPQNSIGNY